jgi:hypothetical protein
MRVIHIIYDKQKNDFYWYQQQVKIKNNNNNNKYVLRSVLLDYT